MKKPPVLAILATLGWALSCAGGTETGNPATLTDFSSSACKNQQLNEGQQALARESDADGLQCVEWSRTADTLQLHLLNFPEPCGDTYLGAASLTASGTLELSVYKDTCAVFKCGLCVFDFDFELTGIPREKSLPVRIGAAACQTEPTTFADELTLPVDEQESGIVCRYLGASALDWFARGRGSCGERNMPCGNCEGTDSTSCAADLQCTTLNTSDARCLPTCASDDDCVSDITSCQDGVCRASSNW
jgi:hypothetical protein